MLKVGSQSPTSSFSTLSLAANFLAATNRQVMPVDYASYLLAASPPGFDLHYTLRDHFGVCAGNNGTKSGILTNGHFGKIPSPRSGTGSDLSSSIEREETGISDGDGHGGVENTDTGRDSDETLPIQFDLDLGDETALVEGDNSNHSSNSNSSRSSPGPGKPLEKKNKRVSFADDLGKALVSVRIMTESSDTPPRLRPQILSSLTQGASAGATVTPPLVLNFTQPASDYLEFREKIERNSISLENVIVKDYNLIGTIKVKNICYHKTVFVRCTFDKWESHVDIPASYVQGGQNNSQYDTFSFEISVSPTMDVRNKVQFAVCFEGDGRQFWDNNGGMDYEVVTADWKSVEPAQHAGTVDVDSEVDWPTYSAWKNVDHSVPYW